MRTIFGIAILLAFIGTTGCATMMAISANAGTHAYDVEVLSDPPGARIEVNGDYVGDAPVVIQLRAQRGRVAETYEIRALPTEAGHWVQSKVFNHFGSYETLQNDRLPKRVFFDMRLKPRADVEVEIRQ